MSFPFLSTSPDGSVARSPMADDTAAAGASFEVRDGWQVATAFGGPGSEAKACREAVGWADVSHLGKVEIQGRPERLAALTGEAEPRRGVAKKLGGDWCCPVTPGRVIVLCDAGGTATLLNSLDGAGDDHHVLDLTTSLGALSLAGPAARETFARFCALDLRDEHMPVAGFRPGSVARTPGYVLREDEDRFLILFGAAYGSYMWTVVSDAGRRLGGRPVGVDALLPLRAQQPEAAARA